MPGQKQDELTQKIKRQIVAAVDGKQGCKATELIADANLVEALVEFGAHRLMELVDQLIIDGLLIEIEYIVPTIHWRIKSFLLPAGSEVRWPKEEEGND